MNINLNRVELEKVHRLLDVKELNMVTNEVYRDLLVNDPYFINKSKLDYVNDGLNDEKKALELLVMSYFGDDYQDALKEKGMDLNYICSGIKLLNSKEYLDNPYNKHIHVNKIKGKRWEFVNSTYQPYQMFVHNDIKVIDDEYFLEIPQMGFFKDRFSYLEVYENNHEWMSITPNEIETMKQALDMICGNAVVFGLGLGYFAYMASLKDDVKHITIIEKDKEVIELFNKHILPQFENKDKIEIIEADAFDYIKKMDCVDTCFIDLWHDASDGTHMYLKLRKYEKENIKYSYWIEDSIVSMLRRSVLVVLEDELNNIGSDIYKDGEYDYIFKNISIILKDYSINEYDDIKHLLSKNNLIDLAKKISQNIS